MSARNGKMPEGDYDCYLIHFKALQKLLMATTVIPQECRVIRKMRPMSLAEFQQSLKEMKHRQRVDYVHDLHVHPATIAKQEHHKTIQRRIAHESGPKRRAS